jgi:hypothetical protein
LKLSWRARARLFSLGGRQKKQTNKQKNKQTNNDARLAFVGPHIIFVLGASENVAASYI